MSRFVEDVRRAVARGDRPQCFRPDDQREASAQLAYLVDRVRVNAGETHHHVYRIVDGADDDWASWYAQWLIDLSELPDLLGAKPVRSELIYLLVSLDKQYTADAPGERGRPTTHARSCAISGHQAVSTATVMPRRE